MSNDKEGGIPKLCAFCVPITSKEYTGCVCALLERGLTMTGVDLDLKNRRRRGREEKERKRQREEERKE